ncbi:MAG: aspartate aminotransferase family protein [Rhodospirillales bacterium]|jgi:acetylornithine/N-succinyldiaminopimelate aminotransferase|nr:aspartate aminotransferase family protein [Rhodospirillales bacterium]
MSSPLMATYDRHDVAFERGEGAYLYGTNGRRYLDFAAGVAVDLLGHCHPHLVAALEAQARRLWHCSNLYRVPEQERLAARLIAHTFADRAFFCNSGAEALECAIKLVRKFHDMTGHPERYRIIAFNGAFHGRTLATIAAGGSAKHLAGFDPPVDGFDHLPLGDAAAVRAAIGPTTAAVLIEPVQGEGGVRPVPPAFLRELRAIADAHGLLLVFDEVQCGMGRTGRLFAHEWAGVTPDIMAIAKGLGGGFPIGACLATDAVAAAFSPGSHGSTFGGNPLATAVANAVLDVVLAGDFLPHVIAIGERLRHGLEGVIARRSDVLAEVRGLGLMLGLQCRVANTALVHQLLANGLLSVPAADNVVRLLPPLIIDDAEVDAALEIIDRSCLELANKAA